MRCARSLRRAVIVLHQDGDFGIGNFAERQFGCIAHALRRDGACPGPVRAG